MNFGRVKILLIAVFLGLNIFLAYQWWTLQTAVSVYTEPFSDALANAQSALAVHHVSVKTAVPNTQPQMSLLEVTYDHTGIATIATSLLSLKLAQVNKLMTGPYQINPGYCIVRAVGPGAFRVSYLPHAEQAHMPIDKTHPQGSVKQWFLKHGYNFSNYQELGWRRHESVITVTFAQQYSGNPIFSAVIQATAERNQLMSYSQNGVTILGETAPRTVISAVSALLSLAEFMDKAKINTDNTIQDIRLGYDSQIMTGKAWYLAPVWRIQTIRGVFYVNAFTGEVGVGAD